MLPHSSPWNPIRLLLLAAVIVMTGCEDQSFRDESSSTTDATVVLPTIRVFNDGANYHPIIQINIEKGNEFENFSLKHSGDIAQSGAPVESETDGDDAIVFVTLVSGVDAVKANVIGKPQNLELVACNESHVCNTYLQPVTYYSKQNSSPKPVTDPTHNPVVVFRNIDFQYPYELDISKMGLSTKSQLALKTTEGNHFTIQEALNGMLSIEGSNLWKTKACNTQNSNAKLILESCDQHCTQTYFTVPTLCKNAPVVESEESTIDVSLVKQDQTNVDLSLLISEDNGFVHSVKHIDGGFFEDTNPTISIQKYLSQLYWSREISRHDMTSVNQQFSDEIDIMWCSKSEADCKIFRKIVDINVAGNRPPVAMFTSNRLAAYKYEIITFDASGSYDSDNDTLSYFWKIDSQPTSSSLNLEFDNTSNKLSFRPEADGKYFISLTVNDGRQNSSPVQRELSVVNRPVENLVISQSPALITTNQDISINIVSASDPDNDEITFRYRWFVNGVEVKDETDSKLASHWYVKNDLIETVVSAFDGSDTTSVSKVNTVENSPPVINFVSNVELKHGVEHRLKDIISDADNDELTINFNYRPSIIEADKSDIIINAAIDLAESNIAMNFGLSVSDGDDSVQLDDTFIITTNPDQLKQDASHYLIDDELSKPKTLVREFNGKKLLILIDESVIAVFESKTTQLQDAELVSIRKTGVTGEILDVRPWKEQGSHEDTILLITDAGFFKLSSWQSFPDNVTSEFIETNNLIFVDQPVETDIDKNSRSELLFPISNWKPSTPVFRPGWSDGTAVRSNPRYQIRDSETLELIKEMYLPDDYYSDFSSGSTPKMSDFSYLTIYDIDNTIGGPHTINYGISRFETDFSMSVVRKQLTTPDFISFGRESLGLIKRSNSATAEEFFREEGYIHLIGDATNIGNAEQSAKSTAGLANYFGNYKSDSTKNGPVSLYSDTDCNSSCKLHEFYFSNDELRSNTIELPGSPVHIDYNNTLLALRNYSDNQGVSWPLSLLNYEPQMIASESEITPVKAIQYSSVSNVGKPKLLASVVKDNNVIDIFASSYSYDAESEISVYKNGTKSYVFNVENLSRVYSSSVIKTHYKDELNLQVELRTNTESCQIELDSVSCVDIFPGDQNTDHAKILTELYSRFTQPINAHQLSQSYGYESGVTKFFHQHSFDIDSDGHLETVVAYYTHLMVYDKNDNEVIVNEKQDYFDLNSHITGPVILGNWKAPEIGVHTDTPMIITYLHPASENGNGRLLFVNAQTMEIIQEHSWPFGKISLLARAHHSDDLNVNNNLLMLYDFQEMKQKRDLDASDKFQISKINPFANKLIWRRPIEAGKISVGIFDYYGICSQSSYVSRKCHKVISH